jgi:hypothetical protein
MWSPSRSRPWGLRHVSDGPGGFGRSWQLGTLGQTAPCPGDLSRWHDLKNAPIHIEELEHAGSRRRRAIPCLGLPWKAG